MAHIRQSIRDNAVTAQAKMLASQILSMVIRPALSKINLWSPSAEELVLGTAIVESGLIYLRSPY